jgi:hypothetical protein
MKQTILTQLTEFAKERLALQTDIQASYETEQFADLPDKVKQIAIESSKQRIAFDNKLIALIESGLLTKELYHKLGAERIKIDDDLRADLRAAELSEADRTTLNKIHADFKERELALDAKRREGRAAFDQEYGE